MKKMISILLMSSMVVGLVGCGNSSDSSKLVDDTYKGKTLNVFVWPEYIPDSVVEDFEGAYGVKVNMTTFSSNEEMLSKVQSSSEGTYDIVVPSDYMVQDMIADDMLAEINTDIITNIDNMDEQYMDQDFDPGNKYSIPLAPGEIIPCYDASTLGDGAITSLADLFDTKYKDGLVVLDDMKIIIGLASMSLGYSLNESDSSNLEKVQDRLNSFKDNIYTMTIEAAQEHILSGEVAAGYMYNGNVAVAQMENEDIKAVWPEEGSYIWIDNMTVLKSSKEQDLANTFINYLLEPDVDAKMREEIPATDPNKAGWEQVSDELKNCEALNIPEESWAKGQYAATLADDVNNKYSEMWTEFTK